MLFNTRAYSPDRNTPDAVTYAGTLNTLTVSDSLELKRAYPKANGSFRGVAKPQLKYTRTSTINSATLETANTIFTVAGSIPVGTPDADVDARLADLAAFLTSTEGKKFFKSLAISQ